MLLNMQLVGMHTLGARHAEVDAGTKDEDLGMVDRSLGQPDAGTS